MTRCYAIHLPPKNTGAQNLRLIYVWATFYGRGFLGRPISNRPCINGVSCTSVAGSLSGAPSYIYNQVNTPKTLYPAPKWASGRRKPFQKRYAQFTCVIFRLGRPSLMFGLIPLSQWHPGCQIGRLQHGDYRGRAPVGRALLESWGCHNLDLEFWRQS